MSRVEKVNIYLGLLIYEISSKYSDYLFIWPYLINWHLRVFTYLELQQRAELMETEHFLASMVEVDQKNDLMKILMYQVAQKDNLLKIDKYQVAQKNDLMKVLLQVLVQ